MSLWDVVYEIGNWVLNFWILASIIIAIPKRVGKEPVAALRAAWVEVRAFYVPVLVLLIFLDATNGRLLFWSIFLTRAFELFCWFYYKDIDSDDRWKRRKKKLTEKVKERAGRLVVVPAGQES